LLTPRYFNPAEEVLPEQMITGVGCSAGKFSYRPERCSDIVVLDQLFHTLMDEGEAVLIAAP
jgi:1-aminocyclopropane-1-carboxylate synthase